ncbi:MAG: cupin domain-containing protein [Proteobacteria bacterium]|jgi:uncharacterized protein|nr:cupin domain-containing protein [Pseudomonadota bacterium]
MKGIEIIGDPTEDQLGRLGVREWPIWTKEISEFPWTYDSSETCFFLEGDVEVIPHGGDAVRIGAGDLVTFPSGMSCTWKVIKPVKKHYSFWD